MIGKEISFAGRALESIFSRLDSDSKRMTKLGEEIWVRGFDLLNLLGERTEDSRQEKGQIVALACRSLSLKGDDLIIKTPLFKDSEKPEIYFGKEGKKAVIVVPHEGMPWAIPREIGEIDQNGRIQEIKYPTDEGDLIVILNFLKEVSFGRRE